MSVPRFANNSLGLAMACAVVEIRNTLCRPLCTKNTNDSLTLAITCAVMEHQTFRLPRDKGYEALVKKLKSKSLSMSFVWQKLRRNMGANGVTWGEANVAQFNCALDALLSEILKAMRLAIHLNFLQLLNFHLLKLNNDSRVIEKLLHPPPLEYYPQIQTTCAPNV